MAQVKQELIHAGEQHDNNDVLVWLVLCGWCCVGGVGVGLCGDCCGWCGCWGGCCCGWCGCGGVGVGAEGLVGSLAEVPGRVGS